MDFPNIDGAVIALDSETTGLKWWSDDIFGFSVSVGDQDYYWDVRDQPKSLDWLADSLPLVKRAYLHNAKFDAHFFREAGVDLPIEKCICTVVRAALIDEHLPTYNLDFVGKKYVGVGKDGDILDELRRIFGERLSKDALMKMMHKAPSSIVAKYAKQDTRTTLLLGLWQEDEIVRQELQQVDQLERDLLPVLIDMELGGVRVDVPRAEAAVRDIDVLCDKGQYDLNKLAGFEINPNPSGSIHKLFKPEMVDNKWVLVDGTVAESTDAGKPSIDADCLRRMKHPAAAQILRLRKLMKARDTFLKGHILGHHHNGIIHCNINQTKSDNDAGTGTGRLSVNSPALQQISARDKEIAAIVRAIFIPDEDQTWLCGDLSQAEMRWFASYCGDSNIVNKYKSDPNTDFYQTLSDLTGLPRNPSHAGGANCKQISLAAVFGMSDGRLCAEMGYPTDVVEGRNGRVFQTPGIEGQAVLDKFNTAVPGIKNFLMRASSVARSRGYVRSVCGRHLRFPGGQFTHKAGGLILQAANADSIKSIMIAVHNVLKGTDSRLLLSVHDECDFTLSHHDVDKGIIQDLRLAMESLGGVPCKVPHRCDPQGGSDWWEASK